jgi:hypothetical protein
MTEEVAKLLALSASGRVEQEIPLLSDVTTLGRAANCQVVLANDWASRRHAQITRRDDLYWLRDLGSKNGTLLDGAPLTAETLLADGAEIRIGPACFRFVDMAATRTHPALAATPLPLRINPASREVWLHGQKLSPPLTVKQFDLLLYLDQRAGEAISKDELAAAIWPEAAAEAVYDYQVDKMVSRVRDRIGKEWIETVWGFGYRLRRP